MNPRLQRRLGAIAATAAVALGVAPAAMAAPPVPLPPQGPNSEGPSGARFVLPVGPGVEVSALLTVNGETTDNGFRMVGIPDGLGARTLPGSGNDIQTFMNHELQFESGTVRRHGQTGAFVSEFEIDSTTLAVETGQDAIDPPPGLQYYNYDTDTYSGAPGGSISSRAQIGRLCSASLTPPGQLFNAATGRGFTGQIFLTGEEVGPEGRLFGLLSDGTTKQLPRTGLFSWENFLLAPSSGDRTVAVGTDDATPGEVYVYAGTKQATGDPFDRAGFTNGRNFGVVINGFTTDAAYRAQNGGNAKGLETPFSLTDIEWDQSGAAQNTESTNENVFKFGRPEDGAWDPSNPNDFYFLTTASGQGTGTGGGGGLWRMRFADRANPNAGGTISLILDGREAVDSPRSGELSLQSPDNMDIDTVGNLLIQEDPGNADVIARIVAYRIGSPLADPDLAVVAAFDAARFAPGPNNFTRDEESSGIIDTRDQFGVGTFLFDAQVHTSRGLPPGTGPGTVQEYVENGQLGLMRVNSFAAVYAARPPTPVIPESPLTALLPLAGLGLIAAVVVARRRAGSAPIA